MGGARRRPLLASLLVGPAALGAGPTPTRAAAPPAAVPAPHAAPFPPETEAALREVVLRHLTRTGTPGAVVGVWIPGRGTWVHAEGAGDLATGAPLTPDATFRIASLTKTFTATVVLQLVDEGHLGLDDPLEPLVPGLPNGERVTVRHLLGMTSGLANVADDPAFRDAYEADPALPFTPAEGIALARRTPHFPPGQRFHYSDTNYLLLGLLIERLTGQRAGEAIEQRVLRPLRLARTGFPTTPDLPEPAARGYAAGAAGGALRDVTRANPDAAWTAGAMLSTLDDLRVWVRALATGELLSPATQAERLRWTAVPGGETLGARYGLGVLSVAGFLGHNGGTAGYSSIVVHLPEANATLAALANRSSLDGGAADAILWDLAGRLYPERFPPP